MKITIEEQIKKMTEKLKIATEKIDIIEHNAFQKGYEAGFETGKCLHDNNCVHIDKKAKEFNIIAGEIAEEKYANLSPDDDIYDHDSLKDFYPDGVDYAEAHGFYMGNDGEWVC